MDVDALLACLAESEPVDPLWLDVEAGRRYTQETAIRRYPQLKTSSFEDLGFVMARKRKVANRKPQDLKTYLAEDVDALAARLAAPEPETVDPLWLEVEAGRRYSQATAMQRYPQLNLESFKDKSLAFQMARKPKIGSQGARHVKTYPSADIDAFVARLATRESEPADPRWLEVEARRRHTQGTAMERYPQLHKKLFKGLAFEHARKPKNSIGQSFDVKTYLAADVDALVARHAAKSAAGPVDPRWLDVEAGRRYTRHSAMARYPQLNNTSLVDLDFDIARRPKTSKYDTSLTVRTFLAADVDAIAARLAPVPVDPRWLDVEAGRRYTATTAIKRYRHLRRELLKTLPFDIARKPKIGNARHASDVKTYLAADIDALAADRAPKRPRRAPREPEPEPEPEPEREEEEEEEAADPLLCQEPLDASSAASCSK